jgi:transcriptional regulator with XRE-family HTH domain
MQVITDEQAKANIAANLRRLRGTTSLNSLAKSVGTCAIHISRMEKGEHLPTGGLIARLAEALNTTADELLGPVPKREKKSAISS